MVSDLVELAKLLSSLVSQKSQLDKQFLENFINPVWDKFQEIHAGYSDSFDEYDKLINNSKIDLSEITNTIRRDSVSTSDQRSQLKAIILSLPSSNFRANKTILSNFIDTIIKYFSSVGIVDNYQIPLESDLLRLLIEEYENAIIEQAVAINPTIEINYSDIRSSINIPRIALIDEAKKGDRQNFKDVLYFLSVILRNRYEAVAITYQLLRREVLT